MKKIFFIKLLLFLYVISYAQKSNIIKIENPSFEDLPAAGHAPQGWYDCGLESETPPDIHPNIYFGVKNKPENGDTFLGLVTRDNLTYEAIGQMLKKPLQNDTCYEFSISLARSENYMSMSRLTNKDVNYNAPVVFNLWGGNKYCSVKELLAKSQPITHSEWRRYVFTIKPQNKLQYIMFATAYPTDEKTNGNLLLDNASNFVPCKCNNFNENK